MIYVLIGFGITRSSLNFIQQAGPYKVATFTHHSVNHHGMNHHRMNHKPPPDEPGDWEPQFPYNFTDKAINKSINQSNVRMLNSGNLHENYEMHISREF